VDKPNCNALFISKKVLNLFSNYMGLDPFRFRTVEAILTLDSWATNFAEPFIKERDNKANKEVCSHLLFVKVATEPERYKEEDNSCPHCRKAIDLLRELYHAIKHNNRHEERQALAQINAMCPGTERHGNTDTITNLLKFAIEQDENIQTEKPA
jgi:hypothetical protein